MTTAKPIIMTADDHRRLSALVAVYTDAEAAAADSLQLELDAATVVDPSTVASSIVTMNSRVLCRDAEGRLRSVEVVYPRRSDASAGRVSVLAPLGRALLGASVGARVEVASGGRSRVWTIEAIQYQPEAAGDHLL